MGTPATETFTSTPSLPLSSLVPDEPERLGMDGAEEDDDEDEELGIEGIEEDEDEDEVLGIDGIEEEDDEELLGIDGDEDEDDEELGIDGIEDDDEDGEELGIDGMPLLELELCCVDSQAARRPNVSARARDLSAGTDLLMVRSSTVASARRNG